MRDQRRLNGPVASCRKRWGSAWSGRDAVIRRALVDKSFSSRPSGDGLSCSPSHIQPTELALCETALCVELLTVGPCGERDGEGIVEVSLFPRGLRSWPSVTAGYAAYDGPYCGTCAADIMAKALNPLYRGRRKSPPGRSRPSHRTPPLNSLGRVLDPYCSSLAAVPIAPVEDFGLKWGCYAD